MIMHEYRKAICVKEAIHLNMASIYEDIIIGMAYIFLGILYTEAEAVQLENEGQVR